MPIVSFVLIGYFINDVLGSCSKATCKGLLNFKCLSCDEDDISAYYILTKLPYHANGLIESEEEQLSVPLKRGLTRFVFLSADLRYGILVLNKTKGQAPREVGKQLQLLAREEDIKINAMERSY
ncbi:hypothetical protein TNCV_4486121 [Trichonephila clavipes]|nr:hypothetical protein TNCV_4486121 [Trichonephila clavipes]